MKRYLLLIAVLVTCLSSINSQWIARHNLSPAEYQAAVDDAVAQGMRPVSISGYTINGAEKYAMVFEKKNGPAWAAKHGLSAADYQAQVTALGGQGYQVAMVSGYSVGGQVKYAAIWEKKSTTYIARHGQNASQFQTEFDNDTKAGYRLIYIDCYASGNTVYYASIFEKSSGPSYYAHFGLDANAYQQKYNTYTSQGYRVKVINGCNVNGTDYYAAIFEKTNGPMQMARHGIKGNNYQNNFDNAYYQGYKPVYISGFASSGTERMNGLWENTNMTGTDIKKIDDGIKAYMNSQGVKALSLAVCKDDRLVFAKGYGDANTSTGQDLSPSYSMRIMSVSKPMTATGIMKLIQMGKLTLDKKVFGSNSIFGSKYTYPATNKTNLEKLTVRLLIHHTSGLRTCNGEAPFWNSSSTYADCMNVLLNDVNLFKFTPNTQFNYANTNFFILARIIEEVSGQGYETFMRTNVLNPSGVGNTMYIGATDGKPTSMEVAGYTPMNNMNLKMWDGFGGWVARPIDLLKVLVRFDDVAAKPDIIPKALHDTMVAVTPVSGNYGCGWIVDNAKQTHNGCFGGTRSFLWHDIGTGLSFAVIINNDPSNDGCGWTMQAAVLAAIKSVSAWPGYDLF